MKALPIFAVAIFAGWSTQELSREEIGVAIEAGFAGKTARKTCGARGDNGFDFLIQGPVGRIMQAAHAAKRANRVFTATDVTMQMAAPVVTVFARRDPTLRRPHDEYVTPGSTPDLSFRTDIALRSRAHGKKAILLEPTGGVFYDPLDASGTRVVLERFGGSQRDPKRIPFPGSNVATTFDLAAFKALPRGDIDVVLFAIDAGEHKCTISDKERQAIR